MLRTRANPVRAGGAKPRGRLPLEGEGQPGCQEDPTPVMSREGAREAGHGLAIHCHHRKGNTLMLAALRKRHEREDEGFTLIELMVVILIIAILLAIAIPTFLGAQNRAKDRAAQSDLRNALTAAKTLATDQEGMFRKATSATTFGELEASDLWNAEKSLTFTVTAADATAATNKIYLDVAADYSAIVLAKQSKAKDNMYWGVYADKDGTVKYCKADAVGDITLASCVADSFANANQL